MAGRNRGTEFERRLEQVFMVYDYEKRALIRKVDPPTKIFGKQVVLLRSPFLDFVGVWTERGGQMLTIEAKSTKEPRLQLGADHGLNYSQLLWARCWQDAGALVLILWEHKGEVRVITPSLAKAKAEQLNRKSIRWCDACRMPGENGMPFDPLRWVDTWRK